MPYPIFALVLCATLLAVAALRDLETRRIPNAVTGTLLASGLVAQGLFFGGRAALAAAGAVAIAGAIHVIPWTQRLLGGGDLKLAAAAAAWTGLHQLPLFLLATALFGGVVSIVAVADRLRVRARSPLATIVGIRSSFAAARGTPVPYGVAIAAGALVALIWRPT